MINVKLEMKAVTQKEGKNGRMEEWRKGKT